MGGGARRRQHHAQQEAMRQATREATAINAQIAAQEKANQQLAEALKPGQQKYTPPPMSAAAMLGTRGIRPRKARKSSTLARGRGISQLRIPLNVGQGAAGGTNIP